MIAKIHFIILKEESPNEEGMSWADALGVVSKGGIVKTATSCGDVYVFKCEHHALFPGQTRDVNLRKVLELVGKPARMRGMARLTVVRGMPILECGVSESEISSMDAKWTLVDPGSSPEEKVCEQMAFVNALRKARHGFLGKEGESFMKLFGGRDMKINDLSTEDAKKIMEGLSEFLTQAEKAKEKTDGADPGKGVQGGDEGTVTR